MSQKKKMSRRTRFWFWCAGMIIMGMLGGLGVSAFVLIHGATYQDLETLRSHKPKMFTRVYDRKGNLIDIFSSEKRIILEYADIPKEFVQALVAVEDKDFFSHIGVSIFGIFSAIKDNLLTDSRRGASTLTQQLVKNITQDRRNTYTRKLKEQFLAVQLELLFTKEEIFAMYANEIALGNNQFGIEAAARYYFDKSVGALNLAECATLAGIPQGPGRFDPYRHPEACTRRRNHVIDRMIDEKYVAPEVGDREKKRPLVLRDRSVSTNRNVASHFVDKVREHLFQKYGEDTVRSSGWDVHTTLDMDMQRIAEEALAKGLKEVDKRNGYRPWDCPSVFKGETADQEDILQTYFDQPSWHTSLQDGVAIRAVIMEVEPEKAVARIRNQSFPLTKESVAWTHSDDLTSLFKVGDVPWFIVEEVEVEHEATDEQDKPPSESHPPQPRFELMLDQEPIIESALVALDPATGDILAMVGGYDYRRSKFNKAEQAKRQVGSAFKPVVYGSALEQGFTLADQLFDEPTLFVDPTQFTITEDGKVEPIPRRPEIERAIRLGLIPEPEVYSPQNYYLKYDGRVTLRQALARSKNIVAVKLLNAVGYDHVLDYAFRLGLGNNPLQPYPSLALGAFEMSLMDLCSAYGAFAMEGIRFDPRFISLVVDRKGQIVEQNLPRGEQVLSPENAFLVTSALQSVIDDPHGTAHNAAQLNLPLAGKTGTTDDYTDAWFVGYHPHLVAGVWVGHESKITPIGRNATGGNTALPIWIDLFEHLKPSFPKSDFVRPPGIVAIPVDKISGKRMTADCGCDEDQMILEFFLRGTEPVEVCNPQEQQWLSLPWFLQKKQYEYDHETGQVKPALVRVNYESQRAAMNFLRQRQRQASPQGSP